MSCATLVFMLIQISFQAFENKNSNFLEDLRRISDQTSKKETEDEAEMKAKREDGLCNLHSYISCFLIDFL